MTKMQLKCLGTNLFHIVYFEETLNAQPYDSLLRAIRALQELTFVHKLLPVLTEFPWDGNVGNSTNPSKSIDICQVSSEISEWRGLGLKAESTCNDFKFQPRLLVKC